MSDADRHRAAAVTGLAARLRDHLDGHGLSGHARLLDDVDQREVVPRPSGRVDLPVLGQLPEALTAASAVAALVGPVRDVAPGAAWTRTADYVRHPPGPGFLEGYAHATLLGSPDGGPTVADRGGRGGHGVSVGLLLLGRGVVYPPHHHPADEVYVPLADADWWDDATGAYRHRRAGVPLHHDPWRPHGTRVAGPPLLAVYLWSGDVTTPSRWCAAPDRDAD